uniref:protein acetyllysine N-acetyltransferase n=1 Tax=Phlebotomus papatasi TaxID=29031 RepID=A0A1B0D9H0_PHLPP
GTQCERENSEERLKLNDDSKRLSSGVDSSSSSTDSSSDSDTDTSESDSQLSSMSDILQMALDPTSATWIQSQLLSGISPRVILDALMAGGNGTSLPEGLLWYIISFLAQATAKRHKLPHINTVDDTVRLLKHSQRILVLTGAGVSVSCGIPDFRSRDGIYRRLAVDFPDLAEPQAMFDISYFSRDPRPFYRFARDIYPGQFRPSPCHRFIRRLEECGRLLRNYTQNIDTLERLAGIERVIECHGSFGTASCTRCGNRVDASAIADDIRAQRIPMCAICQPDRESMSAAMAELPEGLVQAGIMKPDIVFFGEGLPTAFHDAIMADRDACDLLIVIGSSLKVHLHFKHLKKTKGVPQILINREPLPHMRFDVELLGDSDVIIDHLCNELGGEWRDICWREQKLCEITGTYTCNTPKFSPSGDTLDGPPDGKATLAAPSCLRDDSGIGESSNSMEDSGVFCRVGSSTYLFPGAEYQRPQVATKRTNDECHEENDLEAPKKQRL